MPRRKELSPEERERKELVENFFKSQYITDSSELQAFIKEMMHKMIESSLEDEFNEVFGYTRYDYRNKEMENIRNGYSSKTLHTGMGDMGIFVLRGRKGECDPRIVPRHSNTISRGMEAKIVFVYARG